MPGFVRDLAVVDPWDASLERSLARRARAGRAGRRAAANGSAQVSKSRHSLDPFGLGSLFSSKLASERRDLAATDPWELSLGRSRARRRAAELRFVPSGTRAKRLSLGALAALTVGPTASLAEGGTAVAATSSEPATTTEHTISLSSESQGRQVEMLQEALGIGVDGVYGEETEAAVRSFQARHGLAVDGIVGPATIAALRSGAHASGAGVRRDAVNISSEEGGSSSDGVARLQGALHLSADGVFGPETEAAVRRLQARHGLTVDGIVGPATWSAIGVSDQETLTPPASALAHHHSTATVADTGDEPSGDQAAPTSGADAVTQLQSALHLSADGTFGPETEAAVRRLQARHGLTVDGVVGPATWSAIGVSGAPTLKPPHAAVSSGSSGSESSSSSTGESSGVISRVIAAGDEIATRPYVFGGGHGSFQSAGYDCSGSVSYALHGGGLLSSPEDSSQLESYGEAGPGKHITIYANAEHAFMVIDGKRFDTIAQQETGTRWSDSLGSTGGYVARHPDGM
jgi:peptidoglycan hydrolase-like protein with peptidoglycan-binding domain